MNSIKIVSLGIVVSFLTSCGKDMDAPYKELNTFLLENAKCCEKNYGVFENTPFLFSSGNGAIRSIDLQKASASPSDYQGYSVELQCHEAQCISQAFYKKSGNLTEIIKVDDPSNWALHIPFPNQNARDNALQIIKSLPEGKGADPNVIYSIYKNTSPKRQKMSLTGNSNQKLNTYQLVKTERNNLNAQILTKYISCSQGGVKAITVNESIDFYADSEGKKHSNFHDAAITSCN